MCLRFTALLCPTGLLAAIAILGGCSDKTATTPAAPDSVTGVEAGAPTNNGPAKPEPDDEPVKPGEPASEPAPDTSATPRPMEKLGRGVVATRRNATSALVTWRLLGLDPDGLGFNVYRRAGSGTATLLNDSPLTGGTNFVDSTADLTQDNDYYVAPVLDGDEQDASAAFKLTANHAVEPVVRVKIRPGGKVKFVWVGDLNGDGEYDYVLDRQTSPQSIEAYLSDGTFLWETKLGYNSTNQNNIEGGSATIDVGNWDGVTVFDFDSDGKAEVALRAASGVKFNDGTMLQLDGDVRQAITILDGMTGALRAQAPLPDDYLEDGPMYARFGVGYLDGVTPHLVAFMKNRHGNGGFNLIEAAWRFDGSHLDQAWKWLRESYGNAPDGHNTRVIDVDGDGVDEVAEIGFLLNGDGTLRYSLGNQGIVHGDRFHIAKMDPDRPGLQGYGVQQDNSSGLLEYYYDATDGTLLWEHKGTIADVGRGMAGDIDPRHPGMEVWSFSGVYNASSNTMTQADKSLAPWPHLGLWWDGDLGMELVNSNTFQKWNPEAPTTSTGVPKFMRIWHYGATTYGDNPMFLGDIMGDWREEVVYTNGTYDELIIFTTSTPTDHRIYTLPHNPAYRNAMTLKGYMQSHHPDFFLGYGMAKPTRPNIRYVD